MKQRAVVFLAACAVLFSAAPVCALTPGTCADWEGKWVFSYDNESNNDNITITSVCSKPTPVICHSCLHAYRVRAGLLAVRCKRL